VIEPESNHLPELSGLTIEGEGSGAYAEIEYSDADANCPVLAEIVFDEDATFTMYPASLDYSLPVTYRTETGIEPLANGTWTTAVARFSDNESDIVEQEIAITGILDEQEPGHAAGLRSACAPNPFNATTVISFVLPESGWASVTIYDARGGIVRSLLVGELSAGPHAIVWNGMNDGESNVAAGLYFCRISACGLTEVQKLLLVR
jgi:hypothetical protein